MSGCRPLLECAECILVTLESAVLNFRTYALSVLELVKRVLYYIMVVASFLYIVFNQKNITKLTLEFVMMIETIQIAAARS